MNSGRRLAGRRLAVPAGARKTASLGIALALAACVTTPPPGPTATVLPGRGKAPAAFQQDELICQRHALAHTGYADAAPSGPPALTRSNTPASAGGTTDDPTNGKVAGAQVSAGAGASDASVPAGAQPFDEAGYLQCMASRGDTVQPGLTAYAGTAYPYGYAYAAPYGYPYSYGYPFPFYDGGFYGGFGWDGWGRGGWYRGGWAHGGWGHGGFARGGFGHGGGGHGGGGHR